MSATHFPLSSEEIFRAALDHSSDSVVIVDCNFKILYFNPTFLKDVLRHRQRTPRLGMTILELFGPSDFEISQPYYKRAFNGETCQLSYTQPVGDDFFYFEVNFCPLKRGDLIYGVSIMTKDVTPSHKLQLSLSEEKRKLDIISEHIGDVIWMTNAEKDKLLFISKAYEKVFGLSVESHMSNPKQFMEVIHKDDLPRVQEAIFQQPHGNFSEIYRIITPQKELKWIHDRAFPVRDNNDQLISIVGIASDITQSKRQEELIQDQQAKIFSTAKFSALGEMAGGIAHEINNPLAVIHSKADQLRRRSERGDLTPEAMQSGLKMIEQTCQRIVKIIKGLRAFSRNAEKDPFENVSLQNVINDTLELCRERFRSGGVEVCAPSDLTHTIECRPTQIQQVLLNLFNNAYDAVATKSENWIEISVADQGPNIQIRVTDSGRGIPADIVQKMMQPFFTTKEIGIGTGLGLSISRGIIEDHQGQLYFDSAAPNTSFVIELPKRQAK